MQVCMCLCKHECFDLHSCFYASKKANNSIRNSTTMYNATFVICISTFSDHLDIVWSVSWTIS